MKLKSVNKLFFIFTFHFFLLFNHEKVTAQKIEYSSENVFADYPDHLQLVANIAGNHHLVSFIEKEEPVIFIFDRDLLYKGKIRIHFKFPERSEMRIIPLQNYYYLYIHPPFTTKYYCWKIDGEGNVIDMSIAFQNLLVSQSANIKLGFQLIANEDQLCMVYNTDLTNVQKRTLVIVQTDSLLNVVFAHKVMYDFKRDEERLQQEILMFGRFLLVLKTARSGTSLEVMKVNLASGYTITNTFRSSGYFYSQSSIAYNSADSTITVSSLLTEPRTSSRPKSFVFISRLNKILMEQVPFTILKSQFVKNTTTNFFLFDRSKWVKLGIGSVRSSTTISQYRQSLYRDFTMPDPNIQNALDNNRLLEKTSATGSYSYSEDPRQDIAFSLLDKNFKIINDSVVSNSKRSYTIQTNNFNRFRVNDKEYMLVGHTFFRKSKGLLMVHSNDNHLIYTNVRVNDRNDYLLSKAHVVPHGILVPYMHRREAGLVKIMVE